MTGFETARTASLNQGMFVNVKSIVAFICAALALAACTPTEVVQDRLMQQIDTTDAECTGRLGDFTRFQYTLAFVDCGANSYTFMTNAATRIDRYAICVFTFGPAINYKGTGEIRCDNDTSGYLTYDRSDVKHIKVSAMLNNDRRMDFVMHGDEGYPNLPPDTAAP
jgi:hypothetical protein